MRNLFIQFRKWQTYCNLVHQQLKGWFKAVIYRAFKVLRTYGFLCLESKRMLMAIIPPALRNLSLLQEIKDA
tara:strand:+ start:306 stop:521 length:216 start_codon:yes stop_codon:yes gene_type:complete